MADMAGSLANPPSPSEAAQANPTANTTATSMWLRRTSRDPPVSLKAAGDMPGGDTLFANRNMTKCKVSDTRKSVIPIAVAAIMPDLRPMWEALVRAGAGRWR